MYVSLTACQIAVRCRRLPACAVAPVFFFSFLFFSRQDGHFSIQCGLTDDQLLAKGYKKKKSRFSYVLFGRTFKI